MLFPLPRVPPLCLPLPRPHVSSFSSFWCQAGIFKEHGKVVKGMNSAFKVTYWLCDLGQVTALHPSFFNCKMGVTISILLGCCED